MVEDFDLKPKELSNLCKYEDDPLTFEDYELVDICSEIDEILSGFVGIHQKKVEAACSHIASKIKDHHKYGSLAGRLHCYLAHRRLNEKKFIDRLRSASQRKAINSALEEFALLNCNEIEKRLDYRRDYKYDYFGYQTFKKLYIQHDLVTDEELMCPQDVLMGVSLALHIGNLEKAFEMYDDLSNFRYTCATPTLANAMYKRNQMSSCYLFSIDDDSIRNMYFVLGDMADVSATGGGMALSLSALRSKGSLIRGSGGKTDGIYKYLHTLECLTDHVNQGNTRKGALALYMGIWSDDILDFMRAGSKHLSPEFTAPLLNYGVMIPNIFIDAIRDNDDWCLFSASSATGLDKVSGAEFESLYNRYKSEGRAVRKMPARTIVEHMFTAWVEQGNTYFIMMDNLNKGANQKNLGHIGMSNLCTEISLFTGIDYSGKRRTPVCVLSSISLPYFYKNGEFDYEELGKCVQRVAYNLNCVIDVQYNPTSCSAETNEDTRAIGIGSQGWADVFAMMNISFESEKALELTSTIQECIYYNALKASCALAKESGPYKMYSYGSGSDLANGVFHHDIFGVLPSGKWDWEELRADIAKYGVRNSTVTCNMPTASTSQILGNNECFEPFTSNVYTRTVLGGKYVKINKHLINLLEKTGRLSTLITSQIVDSDGDVQGISCLTEHEKMVFKTAFQIPYERLMELDGARQAFVDQSQSSNRFIADPTYRDLVRVLALAKKYKLKTASYYLHTKVKLATAVPAAVLTASEEMMEPDGEICTMQEGCLQCSS